MIVDSSAIVAIVIGEPSHEELVSKLSRSDGAAIGTPTLVETGIVLQTGFGLDAQTILERFLLDFEVSTIPFGEAHWREAVAAHRRYGKGRHPAGLNFGDCLTYAAARLADQPLLCLGDDFPRTDLRIA